LLACDRGSVRASMTGAWLRQLGHANVYVLEGGVNAWTDAGLALESGYVDSTPALYDAARSRLTSLPPAAAATSQRKTIFVGTSEEFAAGHLPGATWLPRGFLELQIAEAVPAPETSLLVTCKTGIDSVLSAATLLDLGYRDVTALEGGTDAARKSGVTLETGLSGVTRAPNDVLPTSRSYAEMLNYLRWEEDLGHKYAR
jgi:rhodanese-related sulfurtransferase